MIKNIFGRIMALWALVIFIATMLIFWIPIWVTGIWKEPKRTIHVFFIFRLWMSSFFILTGVRRKIVGRENFKKGVAYIVVCNHNSFMDPPLSSPGIPGINKTIAKEEMARIPVFGMIYRRGSVLVNRKSEESRRKSYLKMKEVLDMGFHMCIYPEGTRNKTNAPMTKFHDGAFKLAIDTGKQIMPAVIFNTAKVLPRNKTFFFWPYKVEMHFLPPVPIENKTVTDLKNEVFQVMESYYIAHQ